MKDKQQLIIDQLIIAPEEMEAFTLIPNGQFLKLSIIIIYG